MKHIIYMSEIYQKEAVFKVLSENEESYFAEYVTGSPTLKGVTCISKKMATPCFVGPYGGFYYIQESQYPNRSCTHVLYEWYTCRADYQHSTECKYLYGKTEEELLANAFKFLESFGNYGEE